MNTKPHSFRWVSGACALAGVLALGGCVVAPEHSHRYGYEEDVHGPTTSVYVRVAPPAPRMEYRGYPPAVGYLWIEGYWNWGGVSYLWVPGRWVAPRPGYVWVPHRWDRDGDRWRHDGGRWEPEHHNAPRQDWERERERPQVWPAPPSSRVRPDDNARDPDRRDDDRRDNDRWRGQGQRVEPQAQPQPRQKRGQDLRSEPQRRAEPEPEQRSRGFYQRNEPRDEAQRGNDREQHDQRRPDHRGKDDDWRKDKDKDREN